MRYRPYGRYDGQLCAGFADGLRRDNADRLADIHLAAVRHVLAIAAGADAVARAAGQHGAHKHALDARVANCLRLGVVNQLILVDKHFAGRRIGDVGSSRAAAQTFLQRFDGLLAAEQLGNMHAANRQTALQEAVFLTDDNFLRNIDQTAGQIARVSGFHSRVGQSLTGTVRRQEELLHVQTLAEVCTNGQFHGLAGRRCHQPRIPASCDTCAAEPRAPESVNMRIGLKGSRFGRIWSRRVFVQVFHRLMTRL